MSSTSELTVQPADVRTSGENLSTTGELGATCRSTLADNMGGNTSGWKSSGKVGFATFVETLRIQSTRIRTELNDISANLGTAADTYEREEQISASQLTLRHRG